MKTYYLGNLSRPQLKKHFELERQEWLFYGMSAEEIERIHFGAKEEKRRGGDYRVWLDELRRMRPNHKYAPGSLLLTDMDTVIIEGINDGYSESDDADLRIDFEAALKLLTQTQKFCFVEVQLKCRTERSVANELGISQPNVHKHIQAAKEKLKKYFSDRL